MRVAVQGCGHGDLRRIYRALESTAGDSEARALFVCGDFQAVRDTRDLATLDVPARYRRPGDFGAFFAGSASARVPTLYIGGNHEAAEHAWALYHGGWAAPNILYMGHAGAFRVGGLTVAGVSGIGLDSPGACLGYGRKGWHHVRHGSMAAKAYHTRAWEAARMHTYAAVLRSGAFGPARRIDAFLSHEWPRGMAEAGDTAALLRTKPFLAADLAPGGRGLGSVGLRALMDDVRPRWWFAAHMHVAFGADVVHAGGETTRFLALDKCVSGREHLRVVDIPSAEERMRGAAIDGVPAGGVFASGVSPGGGPSGGSPPSTAVEYDPAWLAVVRAYDSFMNTSDTPTAMPTAAELDIDAHVAAIKAMLARGALSLAVPVPAQPFTRRTAMQQTSAFCAMLGLADRWAGTQ